MAEAMYMQLLAGSEKLPTLACKTLDLPMPPTQEGGDQDLLRTVSPHLNSDDEEAYERAISHNFV